MTLFINNIGSGQYYTTTTKEFPSVHNDYVINMLESTKTYIPLNSKLYPNSNSIAIK